MMHKWIFNIGQRLRNPSMTQWTQFLLNSEQWSQKELEEYQLNKLKELVTFAYHHSVFYKEQMDAVSFHPKELESLQDLEKLPILTKEILLAQNTRIHTNFPFKKKFLAATSGSSGNSLAFYRDESADSFNRASMCRGYSWYHVKPWERNGYFWGFNFSFLNRLKMQILDRLQNRFRIFKYDDEDFEIFVKKLKKARYLHGYSSMIFESAKLLNQKQLPKPNRLKMVKGTSEKILDSYQDEVMQAFGCPIISEYGATESGIIAFECPEGKMHINMEGVIVEEINNEIVVTNLQMKSFPVIRYKLGDYIELAAKDELCKCGREHRILNEVTGRIGANVYGKVNMYPSLYFYYIFKNLSINHQLKLTYLVEQRDKGVLQFYILEEILSEEKQLLEKEIVKYFGSDITFTINRLEQKSSNTSKTKSFISYI
ncbi:phenylacetate--CoA ligase family protein [Ascidiimonas sp. W6]|uniref:phenylacetate--CoA ligase family protein n=1 Tax=Ascidiimonas meishanensis TaxID=3128903 RepID=UPI0030EDE1BC